MTPYHSDRFHFFNLFNMALGTVAFAVSVALALLGGHGEFFSAQAQMLLGKIAFGAPLYVALFWYLDRLFRPLWFGASARLP